MVLLSESVPPATVTLFGANRIQARRKNAGELADKLNEWGLSKLATPLKAYSYGDYSEAIHGFVELAKDLHASGATVFGRT